MCDYNIFSFQNKQAYDCRELLPFSPERIHEVQHSQLSSSSRRCWMGLRSARSARQSTSSTPNWENHFFFQKALCVELSHVGTAKGQTQTVAMQSMIPLCVISLRSPFSGTMKVCGHIAHVLCDDIEIYLDFVTSLIYESTHNSNRQQKKTLKKTLKNRCGV